MYVGSGRCYPITPNPKDVREAQLKNQENYFFIDVQSRGEYQTTH